MPVRSPADLASLIAVNITPVVGIAALGWQPPGVLISYFVDTFVGFCSAMLMMMIHLTGDEQDTPIEGWKRWSRLVAALVFLAALIILPLALPLLIMFGSDVLIGSLLDSPAFRLGLAVQVLMSVLASIHVHRALAATHDDDRILSARLLFLAARWIVVFVAVATGLVPALGAQMGGLAVVALYAGASIWFELFPEHAMRFVRGPNAAPIVYQDDLETRAAKRRGEGGPPRRAGPRDRRS